LIADETGYLRVERRGASLFFQLISRRCERGPMILPSKQWRQSRSLGTRAR